jgi:hypothetical protein
MKNVLKKIKDKIVWILGGIIALLSLILAIEYEKKKIQKLKNETIMVKSKNEIAISGVESGEVNGREEILKTQDNVVQEKLKKDTQEILDAKKPKDRTIFDIADGFNNYYGRSNEGKPKD